MNNPNWHASLQLMAAQYLKGIKEAQREGDELKKAWKPLAQSLQQIKNGTRKS